MKKELFSAALATILLASCNSKPTPDQLALEMILSARTALSQHDYQSAKDSILSMREKYPTAIKARRQGILLLDSVELAKAREELAPIGPQVDEARTALKVLMEKPHYKKDPAYHEQNRAVFHLEQLYDSLATKVKFFERKLLEDQK